MSIKSPDADKRTDHCTEPDDLALIDESTIRRLEDEETDEEGCRFAAVARSLEHVSAPNAQFSLPCTRVAYVDESGEYGVERQYIGHRPEWSGIPRTVVVTDTAAVRTIPSAHTARYESIVAAYQHVLSEE